MPAYLALPIAQGGRDFHTLGTVAFVVVINLAGMVPGYLFFGGVADRIGRKKTVILYLVTAAVLVTFFAMARQPLAILVFGCITVFFGSGLFTGSGTLAGGLFPTRIRAVALGVSYNGARSISALAPSSSAGWAKIVVSPGRFLLAASPMPLPGSAPCSSPNPVVLS